MRDHVTNRWRKLLAKLPTGKGQTTAEQQEKQQAALEKNKREGENGSCRAISQTVLYIS
jgi:hypothetical protein